MLEIPHRFGIRWAPDPAYPETNLVTTFVLTEEKGGTRVTLVATGVEAAEAPTEGDALDGWGMSMQNLKALVEGKPLPY